MKALLPLLLLLAIGPRLQAQSENPLYNAALADSLGADDYGMKMYTWVILKTGPNQSWDKPQTDSLFRGHMTNIQRLVKSGELIVAGPLKKNDKNYRGIFILNVKTDEEAKALLKSDPAVDSGLLEAEIYQWYGSAALPLYLPEHSKLEKKKM